MENNNIQNLTSEVEVRRAKLEALREAGNDPYLVTKYDVTAHAQDIVDAFDEMEGKSVSIAGRMMSRRIMGKASFAGISDRSGKIQIYVKRDDVGEDNYAAFKKWDIGDILGIEGTVFKTKTGEISIHATAVSLLSKSLLPLPEKYHGLTDTDLRYRQRYVDLIVNPEVKDTFVKRSKIISAIREFLESNDPDRTEPTGRVA